MAGAVAGGRRFSSALERRYLLLMGLLAAGLVPAVVAAVLSWAPVAALTAMGAALVFAGAAIAPCSPATTCWSTGSPRRAR